MKLTIPVIGVSTLIVLNSTPRASTGTMQFLQANSILKQGTAGIGRLGLKCAVCHTKTYTSCGICRTKASANDGHPQLCFYPSKGPGAGNSCFLDYHNDVFFGLAKKDCNSVVRKDPTEWVVPNRAKRDAHAMYMAEFIENIE